MTNSRDTGLTLDPKFDSAGLLTAVVTDRVSGDVLMVAHMNAEALAETQATGEAHFWSRSREKLWKKGETSGNVLRVAELQNRLRSGRGVGDRRCGGAGVPYRRAYLLLPADRRGRLVPAE
ncbi:phosphoribosyl-AMP cyclohydrolase [Sphingomonas sp. LR55]